MADSDYFARWDALLRGSDKSPASLVTEWDSFVASCAAGYDWSIYEFTNDRSVRAQIEHGLHDPILQRYPDLQVFHGEVDLIDSRYRNACRTDVQLGSATDPWWERLVPKRAEGEFAKDLSALGIPPFVQEVTED